MPGGYVGVGDSTCALRDPVSVGHGIKFVCVALIRMPHGRRTQEVSLIFGPADNQPVGDHLKSDWLRLIRNEAK